MADIFISHVEEDADVALKLAIGLEEAGYATWCYEADNIPGPSYLIQTGQAVELAKAVVIVISPQSIGSRQVTKEIVRAHEAGKEFIPVRRDISHVQFQTRQPEWREAFGAASSVALTAGDTESIIPRIVEGLRALEVEPSGKARPARITQLRKTLALYENEPHAPKKPEPPPVIIPEVKPVEAEVKIPEVKPAKAEVKIPEAKPAKAEVKIPEAKPAEATPLPAVKKAAKGRGLKITVIASLGVIIIGGVVLAALFLSGMFNKAALYVTVSPAGSGTVLPTNSTYKAGTEILLSATPAEGYTFEQWSGDATVTTRPLTVKMEKDKSIVAYFKHLYNLNTSVSPGAGGRVTLNPDGGVYTESSLVVLTAIPTTNYIFDGWSGDITGTTSPVTVNMEKEKNITASFKRVYTVKTTVTPSTGGSIIKNPSDGSYIDLTTVTLTAVPAAGYIFDGWSGDASGKTTTIQVTVNGDKDITARFKKQYQITASVNLPNGGSVSPAKGTYTEGSTVTITATPAEGYVFDRWTGDAIGQGTTVSFIMNKSKNVVAHFARVIFSDTFNDNSNGWYSDGTDFYVANGVYHVAVPQEGPYKDGIKVYKYDINADGLTNFGIEIDVSKINLNVDNNYYGLVFLVDKEATPATEYGFHISGYGNYFMYHETGDQWDTFVNWSYPMNDIKGNTVNKLKVVCRNSVLEYYINNILVQTVRDHFPATVNANGIAVFVFGQYATHITFDNIKVWTITD